MRVYVCAVVQSNENSIRYNASNNPTYQPSFVIRSVTQAFWITLKHPLDMSEINLVANNMYTQKHKYFAKVSFPNFGTYTHSHQFHVYRPYAICVSSTLEGGNVFFLQHWFDFPLIQHWPVLPELRFLVKFYFLAFTDSELIPHSLWYDFSALCWCFTHARWVSFSSNLCWISFVWFSSLHISLLRLPSFFCNCVFSATASSWCLRCFESI